MINPIDIYILIPIILKTLLSIFVPSVGIQTFLIQNGIPLLSLILVAMYRQMRNTECDEKKLETSFFGRLFKSGSTSFILFAVGVVATFVIRFVPGAIVVLKTVSTIPFGAEIVSNLVWGLGVIISYALINLSDDTLLSSAELCKGSFSSIRGIISLIVFGIAIMYQYITE